MTEQDALVPPTQQILSLVRIHDTDDLKKCAIECPIWPVTRTPSSAERRLIGKDKTDQCGNISYRRNGDLTNGVSGCISFACS